MPDGARSEAERALAPGLTLRSVAASLLVIVLSGVIGQVAGVFDSANSLIGVEALPVPALLVVWPLAAAIAGVAALGRTRLLSRAELIVVMLAALIATPLMTVGFWRYQLAGLSTAARFSDWTKLEAIPEGMWPHRRHVAARSQPARRRAPPRRQGNHAARRIAVGGARAPPR
jgi:hypothetical protein